MFSIAINSLSYANNPVFDQDAEACSLALTRPLSNGNRVNMQSELLPLMICCMHCSYG